jgi:prepilin-type processing-associated H-X9-DG protein/prepilin-type N-terminal cleavage/methylation domain-containing protein
LPESDGRHRQGLGENVLKFGEIVGALRAIVRYIQITTMIHHMSKSCRLRPRAFTLTEVLVVVAIVVVLAVIGLPTYQRLVEGSRTAKCSANLLEVFTGIQGYVQENNGVYPPSTTGKNGVNGYWFAAIGPYLGEGRRFDQSKVKSGPWPQSIPFACPSCTNHGWGGAGIDVGINGYQVGATVDTNNTTTGLRIAKASALSTTLLVADAAGPGGGGAWQIGYRIGANLRFTGDSIATRHNGRANVLYFDGHIGQVSAMELKDPKFVERLGGVKF